MTSLIVAIYSHHVQLFVTPCNHQAPLAIFSRQEYWSWLSLPSSGVLPNPGLGPESLEFSALTGGNSLLLSHQGSLMFLICGIYKNMI